MAEYISREDVLKKAKSSILVPTDNEWECGYNTAMAEMQEFIRQLPAADVQPVKCGRWITWDDSGFTKCSCCNSEYYISDLQTVGDSEGFVNFCPNCGARMRGTSND